MRFSLSLLAAGLFACLTVEAASPKPFTPGGIYRAGEMSRPRPKVVTPPTPATQTAPGQPPSDAVVLFDGRDLSQWRRAARGDRAYPDGDEIPRWKVENGCFEVVPKSGWLFTRAKFSDCQIHIEWATPERAAGSGQGRGNSGIFIDGHPEIQVLDSYENDTYPDGQAGGIYNLYPPLVNASLPPGQWQTYDIVYLAPRLEGGKVVQPARYTVFHNGLLIHHAVEVPGEQVECALGLQDHNNAVRYRNIWVRPLRGYDSP